MFPLCCATHPQRKTGEYGSHVISNAKSTFYQGLRSGRQAGVLAQGLLQCLAVVAPQPRLGFVRVLAANHSSRHPALRIRRGKRATPDTSRISHGYRKKAILSRNSSLSGRTQKICGLSAWLREQKDGLLSSSCGANELATPLAQADFPGGAGGAQTSPSKAIETLASGRPQGQ